MRQAIVGMFAGVFVAGVVASCGGEVARGTAGDVAPKVDGGSPVVLVGDSYSPDLVAQTVVQLKADGTQQVVTTLITKEQLHAEEAARNARLALPPSARTADVVFNDTSCASSDVWLYNPPSYPCHSVICFYYNGVHSGVTAASYTDLSTFTYPEATYYRGNLICSELTPIEWAGNVSAYTAGEQTGCLSSSDSLPPSSGSGQNFWAGESEVTGYTGASRYLWLNQSCGCSSNELKCGDGACVSLGTTTNCNSCGNACPTNESCVAGSVGDTCACESPYLLSNGVCCPSGDIGCGGVCVSDSTTSNCGGCGNVCATGATCTSETCTCPTGDIGCNGDTPDDFSPATCVSDSTTSNCGTCGNVCASGASCVSGVCTCPGTEVVCSGTCVDETSDSNNCGSCGFTCATGGTCTGGICGCPAGDSLCGDACVNEETDPNNCNACGTACGAGDVCACGTCAVCTPEFVGCETNVNACCPGLICGSYEGSLQCCDPGDPECFNDGWHCGA